MANQSEIQGLSVRATMQDSGLSQGIKTLSAKLKEVKSEFNLAQAGVKNFGTSLDGLRAKSENLRKQISLQSQMVDKLRESLTRSQTALQNTTAKQNELKAAMQATKSQYDAEVAANGKSTEKAKELEAAYKKLNEQYNKSSERIDRNNRSITDANTRLNNTRATLNTMQSELDATNTRIAVQSTRWYELSQACTTTAARLKTVGTTMKSMGNALTTTVSLPGALLGGATLYASGNFEAQMDRVLAISGATKDEFEALTEKAKEMGATTKFTATEAGKAMEYMAQAGWDSQQILSGVDGMMSLAAASGEELALTSDIVTEAITAFGMSADEASHFADVLAAASAASNTNVEMLGDSFKYAAPLAGAFKMSVEDTALVLGLMANAGVKSSQGGTALRTIFTKLSDDIVITKKNGEELIVQTQNADGTMRSLKSIIDDLRGAFNGMSEAEKTAISDDLVTKAKELNVALTDDSGKAKTQMQLYTDVTEALGNMTASTEGLTEAEKVQQSEAVTSKFAMSGMLALLNASEEDYDKLTNAIYDCNGAAEEMADTMLDNLKGDWTLLKSQLEGVAIQLGEVMIPMFRDTIDSISEWITKFGELDQGTQRNVVKFTLLAIALGPILKIGGSLIKVTGNAVKLVGDLSTKIANAGGLIPAMKGLTFLTNPYVLGVTAICGALLIWKSHCDKVKQANEEMLESARGYEESAKALEELKDKYAEVNKMSDDDSDKKAKLVEIQNQLIDTYGLEAQGIDIVNGKYSEQIGLLEELNDKKGKDAQISFDQNVMNTKKELDSTANSSTFYAGSGKLADGMFKDLNKTHEDWRKIFGEISEDYKGLVELDVYNGNGLQIDFNSDDAEKYKDMLGEIILNARKYGYEETGLYSQLYGEWTSLTKALDKYSAAQVEAFSFRYNNTIGDAVKELGLEGVAEYTEEQTSKIKEYFSSTFEDTSKDYQDFANSMLETLPLIGKATDKTLEQSKEALNALENAINSVSDASKNCTDTVSDFASDLKVLDKAIEKVKDGGELSGEEIVALTNKYGELDVKINETTGTRYIELQALETLRNELPNLSKAQIESEKTRTEVAIKNAKERMKVYISEQQYLNGLVSYNDKTGGVDWGNVPSNVRDNILQSNPEVAKQYQEALGEAQKIQDMKTSLKEFEDSLNDIDTISSTPGKEASSGKDKDSAMQKALEEFEKSVKIGETSLEEEMAYLDTIRDKYASTAEEKVDIEQRMYDNWLSIIERKKQLGQLSVDQEVEMYAQGLEQYTYTEYQKAELSSQLLDIKIKNSEVWIEQEKYYGRLSLEEEKAAYERITEYTKDSAEYKKEMAKEVYRVEKEIEKEKQDTIKKTVESNIKAKEEEYNKTVALIESERDKRVEAYQSQMDALQAEYDKEVELEKQREYDEKIADLEDKMKNVRTQEEFEKLAEELNDTQQGKREYTRDQQLKSDKQLLQDKIDQAKNEASIAINLEKEKLDAYKETQNKMLEEATTIETDITKMLKDQLTQREEAFLNSIKVMMGAYQGFSALFTGLKGVATVNAGLSGSTLANASKTIANVAPGNNYSSSSYNTNYNSSNANMNVTNIIKNAMDEKSMVNTLANFLQKLNRSKGR